MKCVINYNLEDLYNTKAGKTVNILGAGCSLFNVNKEKLEKHDCIYINSAALIIPESFNKDSLKIWLSIDRLSTRWSYFSEIVVPNKCLKFVAKNFDIYCGQLLGNNFRFFEVRSEKISELYDNKLSGPSSVPAAIDLAMKMGYSKILLYGIDHRFIQGKSHFWQFYPKNKQPKCIGLKNISMREQKKVFDKNLDSFVLLKKMADLYGIEIFNCCKITTSLKVFSLLNISEGLKL